MTPNIPIVATVDLLIVGGTSAGVAAALEAKTAGRSVMVVAPRAYLGEDIASRSEFWQQQGNSPVTPLARAVFGGFEAPPTPMHVKLTLEQALVDVDVPVVLNTHPAGVLRDSRGKVRGMLIANRAGRQAILATHVVDASIDGTLCRIAGYPAATATGIRRVTHVTLCNGPGADAPGVVVEHLPAFRGTIKDRPYEITARRYTLEVDLGDGSPDAMARAQAEVVERCWVREEYRHQEELTLAPDRDAAPAAVDSIDVQQITQADGIIALAANGPVPAAIAGVLSRPVAAMALGQRVGKGISEASGGRRGRRAPARNSRAKLHADCHGALPVYRGEIRTLAEALRPGRAAKNRIAADPRSIPRIAAYDVVVIGGGTGGAPAAIAAGQTGVRTAVIEAGPALGGVGTLGQITRYWYGNRVGFTSIIDRGVHGLEATDALRTADGSWSVAAKTAWYHRQCHAARVAMWFRTTCVGAWIDGQTVRGVVVAGPFGYGLIEAKVVIDSTGCADIPAAAGAPVRVIEAEHAAIQGVGLAGMRPSQEYHNTDHNFCDDTDPIDVSAFLISSKRKFADHFDAGQLVDSRERRQIVGEIELGPADFLYDRRFPDTICVASSNFDSHGYTVHPVFMIKPPTEDRLWVDVPYRCLLPRGIRGVLVTGLGVSAHRDALPVIRMQPDVQNQGYAAGRAAAMAVQTSGRTGGDVDVREIDIRALQKQLVEIGNLPQRVLTDRDSFPVAEEALDRAIAQEWDIFAGLALIFADPQRSKPKLHAAIDATTDAAARLRYAVILATMDDDCGRAHLQRAVSEAAWDAGWNYRGMGQFGLTLSATDVLIIALGRVGDAEAWEPMIEKAKQLRQRAAAAGTLPEFSHCRALAMAFEALGSRHRAPRRAPAALQALLNMPGASGHTQTTIKQVMSALTPNSNENAVRNNALREIYLSRALARLGSACGLRTLKAYADDLRGHFARHARANIERRRASRL